MKIYEFPQAMRLTGNTLPRAEERPGHRETSRFCLTPAKYVPLRSQLVHTEGGP